MNSFNENINWIIEAIKAEEIAKLDMAQTLAPSDCGTAGCIYGFAVLKEYGQNAITNKYGVPPMQSSVWSDYFNLSQTTAQELFMAYSLDEPLESQEGLHYLTRDDALTVLQDVRNETFESWAKSLSNERLNELREEIVSDEDD